MALPDLDTSEISWIAYWNHLDNGANSIDPIEATSAMASYEEYTNGVQGILTYGGYNSKSRDFRVRVKDDGWIVAWIDRTAQEATNVSNGSIDGPYDLIQDWTGIRSSPTLGQTAHSNVLLELRNALSNSADSNFNHGDVGHYNYLAEAATTLTMWSISGSGGAGYFTASSGTDLHFGWVTGTNDTANSTVWSGDGVNVTICSSDYSCGARDIIGRGDVTPGVQNSVDVGYTSGEAHIAWS